MLNTLNAWFCHWEPTWLFLVLSAELLVGILTGYMYFAYIKPKKRRFRKSRHRVKIVITEDGQAVVEEAPKGIDVAIERKGS